MLRSCLCNLSSLRKCVISWYTLTLEPLPSVSGPHLTEAIFFETKWCCGASQMSSKYVSLPEKVIVFLCGFSQ